MPSALSSWSILTFASYTGKNWMELIGMTVPQMGRVDGILWPKLTIDSARVNCWIYTHEKASRRLWTFC
jgi:hypothetical protein